MASRRHRVQPLLSGDAERSIYPVGIVPSYLDGLADLDESVDDEATDDLVPHLRVQVDDGDPIEALSGRLTSDDLRRSSLDEVDLNTSELRVALLNRARQELQELDLVEAADTLDRAQALGPDDAVVAAHVAWLRLLCGERFSAGWEARQALAAAPDDPVVVDMVLAIEDELQD